MCADVSNALLRLVVEGGAHDGQFAKWSQLLGSLPAPLFLFLAGVSVALTTEKLREKGMARELIAKQTILRGGEIFVLGLLLRVQEYALGYDGCRGRTYYAWTF